MDWGAVQTVEVLRVHLLRVHLMEGSASGLAWLYLWMDGDAMYRRSKEPDGTESLEMTISADSVRISGTLTKTNRLRDAMRRRIEII